MTDQDLRTIILTHLAPGPLSGSKLRQRIPVAQDRIRVALRGLEAEGVIEHIGQGLTSVWALVEPVKADDNKGAQP